MLIQCPYKDCGHMGLALTNNHCESSHALTRDQVIAIYGTPRTLHERSQDMKPAIPEWALMTTAPKSRAKRIMRLS